MLDITPPLCYISITMNTKQLEKQLLTIAKQALEAGLAQGDIYYATQRMMLYVSDKAYAREKRQAVLDRGGFPSVSLEKMCML